MSTFHSFQCHKYKFSLRGPRSLSIPSVTVRISGSSHSCILSAYFYLHVPYLALQQFLICSAIFNSRCNILILVYL